MFEYRRETIKLINEWQIPKAMLASACGIACPRLSDFIQLRQCPTAKEQRITEAVKQIAYIWGVFSPFRFHINTPELLALAMERASTVSFGGEKKKCSDSN